MPISLVSESATKDGLPRYAFAYAPAEDPSTWRLPYLTADGAPDADALPRALTALVEGRVPMQALPSVKAKLRQAYRRTGVADNDLPDAIRESDMDIALMEYDPGQPRDYHGRWTDSGAGSGDPAPGDSRTGYAPNQIGHDISTPEKRALYDDMMAADRERWLQTAPERLQWNDVRDEYLSAGESLIADFTKRRRDIRSLSVGEVRAMIYAYERRGNAPAIHFWNDALAMKTGQTPSRPIGALLGGSTPPSRMPRSGMSPFQTADKARRQARQQRFGESDQPSYLADLLEHGDPSDPNYKARYHPGSGFAASPDGSHQTTEPWKSPNGVDHALAAAKVMRDAGMPVYGRDDGGGLSDEGVTGKNTVAQNAQNWEVHKRPDGTIQMGVAVEGDKLHMYPYKTEYGDPDLEYADDDAIAAYADRIRAAFKKAGWPIQSVSYAGRDAGFGSFNVNYALVYKGDVQTPKQTGMYDWKKNDPKWYGIKESAEPSYLTGLLAGELGIPQYVIEALVDTDFEEKGGHGGGGHHFYGAWWGPHGKGAEHVAGMSNDPATGLRSEAGWPTQPRSGGTPAGHTHMFDEHPIGSWGQPASDAGLRDPVALVRGYKSLKNAAQSDLEVAAATLAKSKSGDDHALLADIQTELKRRNLVTGDALGMMDAWGGMHYAESDVREDYNPSEARDWHGRWESSGGGQQRTVKGPGRWAKDSLGVMHDDNGYPIPSAPRMTAEGYPIPGTGYPPARGRDSREGPPEVLGHSIDDQPGNPHGFVKIPSSVRRKFEADVHAAPDDLLFTRSNGVPVTMASALTALRHPIISTPRERAEITRAIAAVYGLKS